MSGIGTVNALSARSVAPTAPRRADPPKTPPHQATSAPTGGAGSGFADTALKIAIVSGLGKQALDGMRLVPKLKESFHARQYMDDGGRWNSGRLPTAIRQMLTLQPSTTIIDPRAPTPTDLSKMTAELRHAALAASGGRTFTRLDRNAYITSTLLGAGLAGITLASGAPNMISGVLQEGPLGLVNTKEGRAGLIQLGGGGLAVGLLAQGMRDVSPDVRLQRAQRATDKSLRALAGAAPTINDRMPTAMRNVYEGLHHIAAGARAPRNALPWTAAAGLGSAALLWINRWGYLDVANAADNRSISDRLHQAVDATPLVGALTSTG